MDAQCVHFEVSKHKDREKELLDSEEPDGVMLNEKNCEENIVNFEEVFPDPYEQGFPDGYAKGHTDANDKIYRNAYETGCDDGYEAGFMSPHSSIQRIQHSVPRFSFLFLFSRWIFTRSHFELTRSIVVLVMDPKQLNHLFYFLF